ncbi:MAG: hypothetical protein AAF587_03080 [Bacteroidota bacterium]
MNSQFYLRMALAMLVMKCLLAPNVMGQSSPPLPEIIPPSPTAASLGEYGDVPVGHYTGVPNISIPLYQIQSRDISVPISLNNHAGGIKVEEEASWVGLGWSLKAGGAITRSIRGLDDLRHLEGYPFISDLPNADDNNNYDLTNTQPTDVYYFGDLCNQNKDGEPDLFYFNFGNYSGKFVLTDAVFNPTTSKYEFEPQLLSQDSRILIRSTLHTNDPLLPYTESFYDWEAVTPDGFTYAFTKQEVTKGYSGTGTNESSASNVSVNPAQEFTTNSWYLTRITSPKGEVVTFEYEDELQATKSQLSFSEVKSEPVRIQAFCTDGDPCSCSPTNVSCNAFHTFTASGRTVFDHYLKKIVFSNGYVDFITEDRGDMAKDINYPTAKLAQALDQIDIYIQGQLSKTVDFTYTNFNNLGGNGANLGSGYVSPLHADKFRLKLQSLVEKNGSTVNPPYTFEYYAASGYYELPFKSSKDKDYWGYYNAAGNNNIKIWQKDTPADYDPNISLSTLIPAQELFRTSGPVGADFQEQPTCFFPWDNNVANSSLCDPNSPFYDPITCADFGWIQDFPATYYSGADRDPNPEEMKAGTLKRITYPTGGYVEMEFEAHEYGNFDPEFVWNTNPQNPVIEACGPNFSPTIPIVDCSILPANPTPISINITKPTFLFLKHQVTRDCITNPSNCDGSMDIHSATPYATLSKDGVTIRDFTYSHLLDHPTNNASLIAYTYSFLETGDYILDINAVGDAYVKMEAEWSWVTAPDPEYTNTKQVGGLRVKRLQKHHGITHDDDIIQTFDYTRINADDEVESTGKLMSPIVPSFFKVSVGGSGAAVLICHNYERHTNSQVPLGSSTQGATVGYDQVSVINGVDGSGGKTTYTFFNTAEERALPFFPNMPNRIFNSNGLAAEITHFKKNPDGTFQIVGQTENEYNGKKHTDLLNTPNALSNTLSIMGLRLNGADCSASIPEHFVLYAKFYETTSEWWRMTKSIQREYDQHDPAVFTETTTDYTYHSSANAGEAGYLRSTSMANSKITGENPTVHKTEYGYPEDFTFTPGTGSPIEKMIQDRILTAPIEVLKKVDDEVVSGQFTEFGIKHGIVLPVRMHILEALNPIAGFVPTRNAPVPASPYAPRVEFQDHDVDGNILTVSHTNGQPTGYIYAYAESTPVAKVDNANGLEIAYTSFEDLPPSTIVTSYEDGNWVIERDANAMGGFGSFPQTGLNSFNLSPPRKVVMPQGQLPAGKYIISFWYQDSEVEVLVEDGNQGGTSYPTPAATSEMQYFELEVDVPQNGKITIKNLNNPSTHWTTKIDELRLYPADAMMSTISHDKALRVHTMTDVNNFSSYYIYDGLGRLIEVRDRKGNIVQTMEYKFKQ